MEEKRIEDSDIQSMTEEAKENIVKICQEGRQLREQIELVKDAAIFGLEQREVSLQIQDDESNAQRTKLIREFMVAAHNSDFKKMEQIRKLLAENNS